MFYKRSSTNKRNSLDRKLQEWVFSYCASITLINLRHDDELENFTFINFSQFIWVLEKGKSISLQEMLLSSSKMSNFKHF